MWLYCWKRENESGWNIESFYSLDLIEYRLNKEVAVGTEERVFLVSTRR